MNMTDWTTQLQGPQKSPPSELNALHDDSLGLMMQLEELEDRNCRWPYDTPEGPRFCGQPRVGHSPYCLGHAQRAYRAQYVPEALREPKKKPSMMLLATAS